VKDEATYALERDKLVPVAIESVTLPFRFKGVHTVSLLDWDGSKSFSEFRRLVNDISTIVGPGRVEGETLVVLAIAHLHRRPRYWIDRI
jgi:hypothetical protein